MHRYALRGVVLIVVVVIAFSDSIARIIGAIAEGAAYYTVTALTMAVILLYGIDRRRTRELNIHDREVDYIVGGLSLIIAVTLRWQLVPRFEEWGSILRLDLVALVIFTFGASALLFGMRSTLRFGPAWATLLILNAPVHLLVSLILGGGWTGFTLTAVSFVTVAVMVAVGGSYRRRLVAGAVTAIVGVVLTFVILQIAGPWPWFAYVPALIAGMGSVIWFGRRDGNPGIRHRESPSVERVGWAVVPVLVATVALIFTSLPTVDSGADQLSKGPERLSGPGVSVPTGWSVDSYEEYGWAPRYFGQDATLTRQMMTADQWVPAWDPNGRVRTVAVDTLRAENAFRRRMFGDETLYSTVNGRRSPDRVVDLGHGVTGKVYTVLDEDNVLTYSRLSFAWTREDNIVEHISVTSVDDHRPEARFPELTPSVERLVVQMATVLWRGNAVTEDPAATFKDADLVTTVATDIVDREWRKK